MSAESRTPQHSLLSPKLLAVLRRLTAERRPFSALTLLPRLIKNRQVSWLAALNANRNALSAFGF